MKVISSSEIKHLRHPANNKLFMLLSPMRTSYYLRLDLALLLYTINTSILCHEIVPKSAYPLPRRAAGTESCRLYRGSSLFICPLCTGRWDEQLRQMLVDGDSMGCPLIKLIKLINPLTPKLYSFQTTFSICMRTYFYFCPSPDSKTESKCTCSYNKNTRDHNYAYSITNFA